MIVVWGGDYHIYAQRVGSDGQLKWNNGEPVWIGDGILYHEYTQGNNVVPDSMGGVFIAWQDVGKVVQHVDSDGRLSWQTGGIVTITNSGFRGDLILDGNSGVIVLTGGNDNLSIVAQRIDGLGNLLWRSNGIVVKNIEKVCWGPRLTFIESLGNNEFVIVWDGMEADAVSCDESNIYAQKIDINGNLKWNPAGVMVSEKGRFNYFPHIAADGNNGVWVSFLTLTVETGHYDFGIQHVNNSGDLFASSPTIQYGYNKRTWDHSLVPDDTGEVYLLWDGVGVTQNGDVYAQRFAKAVTIETVIGMMQEMVINSQLNKGEGNALISKLEQASSFSTEQAKTNILQAVLNQINALEKSRRLNSSDAERLRQTINMLQ